MSDRSAEINQNSHVPDHAVDHLGSEFVEITSNASELHTTLTEINTHFGELNHSLEDALQQATETLGSLQAKTETVETQLTESIDQARSHCDTLKEHVEQTIEHLHSKSDETHHAVEELSQQMQSLEHELEAELTDTLSSMTEFQTLADTAKTHFATRKSALIQQFDTFEQQIHNRVQTAVAALTTLIDDSDHHLQEFELLMDTTSTEALQSVTHQFTEDVIAQLTHSAQDLNQAIGLLGSSGDAMHGQLDGSIGEILDKVHQVVEIIEDIKPILDKVKGML